VQALLASWANAEEPTLWIAAIAKPHDFVVVSADDGFARMKDIVDLPVERWWSP
jgi:predicted nucleic acid-binding protein